MPFYGDDNDKGRHIGNTSDELARNARFTDVSFDGRFTR